VARFLRGSVLTEPVFHNTSLEARDQIVRQGIDVMKTQTAGYGRGFYMASRPIARFGPIEVKVAARLMRPLDLDLEQHEAWLEQHRLQEAGPDEVRRVVLAAGHDGIIIRDGEFDARNNPVDVIVGLKNTTMKIVVEFGDDS
jgi:hypothetical protein